MLAPQHAVPAMRITARLPPLSRGSSGGSGGGLVAAQRRVGELIAALLVGALLAAAIFGFGGRAWGTPAWPSFSFRSSEGSRWKSGAGSSSSSSSAPALPLGAGQPAVLVPATTAVSRSLTHPLPPASVPVAPLEANDGGSESSGSSGGASSNGGSSSSSSSSSSSNDNGNESALAAYRAARAAVAEAAGTDVTGGVEGGGKGEAGAEVQHARHRGSSVPPAAWDTDAISGDLDNSRSAELYTVAGQDQRAADRLPAYGLAPLTQYAQRWMWEQQHPGDCSGRRWLRTLGHDYGNGLGSTMHVIGAHFAVALQLGLLFDYGPLAGNEWTDVGTCGEVTSFACFFQRPTNCSAAWQTEENTREIAFPHRGDEYSGCDDAWVPTPLRDALLREFPHFTYHAIKYWWRGQSVAYLMRLNDATVAAVRQLRHPGTGLPLRIAKPSGLGVDTAVGDGREAFAHTLATTWPFPAGMVSAHVRHGDKHTEMTLRPAEAYFSAAESALAVPAPQAVRRALFISTEDPDVLAQGIRFADANAWFVTFSDIPRVNTAPVSQVVELGVEHAGTTVRQHLLQLLMALECDAWVTTRGSNWNRLIDELRCIWVDKCRNAVVEIGTPESWENYNW